MTYELEIKFINGSKMVLSGCSTYGYVQEKNIYYVVKNGYKILFNQNQILYIGRKFDIENN